jgi:2-dehydro-3-deoxyphosphogalactonate aldolase
MTFEDCLREMPLIAILRGVRPQEVVAVADVLCAAGIRIVEVPMNSPQPLKSVSLLAEAFAGRLIVGAGTVVKPEWVEEVHAAGGRIIVAPNTDPAVIRKALDCELEPIPGFATATEAFTACDAGARYLKLFPAANFGSSYVKALRAVLPAQACLLAVGGVAAPNLTEWWNAGIAGFGIGSELYRPGQSPEETARAAANLVAAASRLTPRSTC